MASCSGKTDSPSGDSIPGSNQADTSLKNSILKVEKNPYVIKSDTEISRNEKVISSTYSNYEVNTNNNIQHNYGSKAIINGIDDPYGSDSKTKSYDIYYSPTKTYALGDDQKYSVKDEAHEIKAFSISYDFEVLKDVNGSNSSFTSKVSKSDTASFFKKEISEIDSDVMIKGSLTTIDSVERLTELEFKYTTKASYTCTISLSYEYTMPSLNLPTV